MKEVKNHYGLPDLDLEIIHRIFHIKKEIDYKASQEMEKYDLSTSQMDILACSKFHQPCTSTSLACLVRVSKANLTGVLNRLEKKGLIKREEDPSAARSKIITLTKKGETLVDKIIPKFLYLLTDALSTIPQEEKVKLEKNLTTIFEFLTVGNECPQE